MEYYCLINDENVIINAIHIVDTSTVSDNILRTLITFYSFLEIKFFFKNKLELCLYTP
jgi:hypothetical protein